MSKHFYSFIHRLWIYFQLELVSGVTWFAWMLSTVHVFCGLRVSSFTTTLWLTSCSVCCRSIKQTDHINCTDSTAIWLLLKKTLHLVSFGVYYQPNTHIHVHPSCFSCVLRFLGGRWVSQTSAVCMYVYCSVWVLCSFFMPFLFNLHMPTWGKRPYHRVGINELLCCAQPAQDLI